MNVRVAVPFATRDAFEAGFADRITARAIFFDGAAVAAPVGSVVNVDVLLQSGERALAFRGVVAWAHAAGHAPPGREAGTGVVVVDVDDDNAATLARVSLRPGSGARVRIPGARLAQRLRLGDPLPLALPTFTPGSRSADSPSTMPLGVFPDTAQATVLSSSSSSDATPGVGDGIELNEDTNDGEADHFLVGITVEIPAPPRPRLMGLLADRALGDSEPSGRPVDDSDLNDSDLNDSDLSDSDSDDRAVDSSVAEADAVADELEARLAAASAPITVDEPSDTLPRPNFTTRQRREHVNNSPTPEERGFGEFTTRQRREHVNNSPTPEERGFGEFTTRQRREHVNNSPTPEERGFGEFLDPPTLDGEDGAGDSTGEPSSARSALPVDNPTTNAIFAVVASLEQLPDAPAESPFVADHKPFESQSTDVDLLGSISADDIVDLDVSVPSFVDAPFADSVREPAPLGLLPAETPPTTAFAELDDLPSADADLIDLDDGGGAAAGSGKWGLAQAGDNDGATSDPNQTLVLTHRALPTPEAWPDDHDPPPARAMGMACSYSRRGQHNVEPVLWPATGTKRYSRGEPYPESNDVDVFAAGHSDDALFGDHGGDPVSASAPFDPFARTGTDPRLNVEGVVAKNVRAAHGDVRVDVDVDADADVDVFSTTATGEGEVTSDNLTPPGMARDLTPGMTPSSEEVAVPTGIVRPPMAVGKSLPPGLSSPLVDNTRDDARDARDDAADDDDPETTLKRR